MNQKDRLDLKYKLYSLLANETTFDPSSDPRTTGRTFLREFKANNR